MAAVALAMTLVAAERDLAGVYAGKWTGSTGTAGDCRMELKLTGGRLTPSVMFTMGSTEVKTTVTTSPSMASISK